MCGKRENGAIASPTPCRWPRCDGSRPRCVPSVGLVLSLRFSCASIAHCGLHPPALTLSVLLPPPQCSDGAAADGLARFHSMLARAWESQRVARTRCVKHRRRREIVSDAARLVTGMLSGSAAPHRSAAQLPAPHPSTPSVQQHSRLAGTEEEPLLQHADGAPNSPLLRLSDAEATPLPLLIAIHSSGCDPPTTPFALSPVR